VQQTSTKLKDSSMRYKTTYRALLDLAGAQGGYFTAQQARSVGYSYPEQHYHVTHGNWEKCARGVYRLTDYPAAPAGQLIVLSLQSVDRTGVPQAVVSHETALALYELGDANPAHIHLTVPPGIRRRLPSGVILHRGRLTPEDWEEQGGYRVTTPLRTLRDIAESETSWPLLAQAVEDALEMGLVQRAHLLAASGNTQAAQRVREAVAAATIPRRPVGQGVEDR
jgi:predicted transcriptional regulator of viral defense system